VAGPEGRRLEERVFRQMTGIPADPGDETPAESADPEEFLETAADLVDDARAAETRAASLMLGAPR
jgi:hypothetical protein